SSTRRCPSTRSSPDGRRISAGPAAGPTCPRPPRPMSKAWRRWCACPSPRSPWGPRRPRPSPGWPRRRPGAPRPDPERTAIVRVLVVGGGGREHALVWSLSKSPLVSDLLCAPGNPGIAELARCRPVAVDDLPGMVAMATREFVDLVVVGPEAPLVGGLADALRPAGIRVFGPGAAGARLEGSKRWAKSLMAAAGIPTAASQSFERADEAIAYARRLVAEGTGAVVK